MDLHRHPFDEGTITKLEIFEAYTKEWLPVFVMSSFPHIYIFDLFAGTGRDQQRIHAQLKDATEKEGLLSYDSPSPLVTYDQVFKNHRIITYKIGK